MEKVSVSAKLGRKRGERERERERKEGVISTLTQPYAIWWFCFVETFQVSVGNGSVSFSESR